MAPLTREQYEPLFAKIPIYQSSSVVRSFVADVNGHPRTLMAVLDMLHERQWDDPTRLDLLAELRVRMEIKPTDLNVPAEVIIKALLQQKVFLHDETVPGALSYSHYVSKVSRCILMSTEYVPL